MRYGHFDDAAKEYVIETPATPLPWINYLGNKVVDPRQGSRRGFNHVFLCGIIEMTVAHGCPFVGEMAVARCTVWVYRPLI